MNTAFGAVPDGAVDLHGVDPVAPSPNRSPGGRERLAPPPRYTDADAEAAEGAGIEIGRGLQPDPREAQQVAAIGDGDIVGIGHIADGVEDRRGMHLAVAAARRRRLAPFGRELEMLAPQPLGPGPIRRGRLPRRRRRRRAQSPASPGSRAAAVVDQLARRVGDADEAGVERPPASRSRAGSRACGRARARCRPRPSPRRAWRRRRTRRRAPGRGSPGCRGRPRRWRRAGARARAAMRGAAAGDDQQATGAPPPRRPPGIGRQIRMRAAFGRIQSSSTSAGGHGCASTSVGISIGGPGSPSRRRRAPPPRPSRGSPVRDPRGARNSASRARMSTVRDVPQRAHIRLRAARCIRRSAAPECGRQAGIGDRRHRVGHAVGPRGHHRDAEPARQLGMGVRHGPPRPHVAHVDDGGSRRAIWSQIGWICRPAGRTPG